MSVSVSRRTVLKASLAVMLATALRQVEAQTSEKIQVVGLLVTTIGPDHPLLDVLRKSLRQLGHVEGKNVRFEFRSAYGNVDRLPGLARELAELNVAVIFAAPDPAVLAAKRTVNSVPIAMLVFNTDPVAGGLVESFSKPGGNITGIYGRQSELTGKRLELLRELLPGLQRVAVLYDATAASELAELHAAARGLKVELVHIELKPPYDLEPAFNAAKDADAGAMIVLYSIPSFLRREEFARLALKRRLPTMAFYPEFARAGGLMSYGIEAEAAFARIAYFIDRILKGVKPSELPIEQVSTFKLSLNLRTARALGLTIPQSIRLRIDELIQ